MVRLKLELDFLLQLFRANCLTFWPENLLIDAGQGGNSPHLQIHLPFTGRSDGPILPPAQSFTDPFAVLQDYRFGPAGGFPNRGKDDICLLCLTGKSGISANELRMGYSLFWINSEVNIFIRPTQQILLRPSHVYCVSNRGKAGITIIFEDCLAYTVPKIRFMYSQKWNFIASFPILTFMYLWEIYIFPGSICLLAAAK